MFSSGLLRALRHRAFALVWGGQTLSRVGDFLYQVALAWWVLQETGSATAVGGVFIAELIPLLFFLLIGGVVGDRLPRVPVMFVSDMGRGVLVGVVALLAATHSLAIWHVYVAAFLFGLVDAFFQPAYQAAIPDLAPEDDLPSANSLSSISVQTGRIAGPALAGAIVAWGGPALGFGLNAASFFLAALFLAPLLFRHAETAPVEASAEERHSIWAEVREGFVLVLRSRLLLISIVLFAFSNITLGGVYSVSIPALVDKNLGGDAGTLGFLYAMFPIGYILGGIWIGRRGRIEQRALYMYGGLLLAGLMLGAFGLPLPLAVLAGAAIVNGAALEIGNLVWTNTLQEVVPADKLGRVVSIDMLGSYALLPLGYALVGALTDGWGAPLVILLGGGLTAVMALLALLSPSVQRASAVMPLGEAGHDHAKLVE